MGAFPTTSERVKKVQKRISDDQGADTERRPSLQFHEKLKKRWRNAMEQVVYSAFVMLVMWRCMDKQVG